MKYMNVARKFGSKVVAGSALVLAAGSAMAAATPPDYSTMTSGIDWSSAITGALGLGALLLALYGAIKGAKILIGMVRS